VTNGLVSATTAAGTERLEEQTNIKGWGYWHRSGAGANLGYASSMWHRDVQTGFRKSSVVYPITDDDAIAIEKIVAGMQANHPGWAMILTEHYVRQKSLRELARVIGCDKNVVGAFRDNALSFLLAKLERA
jgi:hypothetical protein